MTYEAMFFFDDHPNDTNTGGKPGEKVLLVPCFLSYGENLSVRTEELDDLLVCYILREVEELHFHRPVFHRQVKLVFLPIYRQLVFVVVLLDDFLGHLKAGGFDECNPKATAVLDSHDILALQTQRPTNKLVDLFGQWLLRHIRVVNAKSVFASFHRGHFHTPATDRDTKQATVFHSRKHTLNGKEIDKRQRLASVDDNDARSASNRLGS